MKTKRQLRKDQALRVKYIDFSKTDDVIKPAAEILSQHGFEIMQCFGGGSDSPIKYPAITFRGNEFDCIRAYELCEQLCLNVLWVARVFQKSEIYNESTLKEIGKNWDKPYNQIEFMISSGTGTIFCTNPA
jgi:hypothetical protein